MLSRLKRHASRRDDKIGSPGGVVNAVARELHKSMHTGDGSGRSKHYSNAGEEMKTASKKRLSFCNIVLIYSAEK